MKTLLATAVYRKNVPAPERALRIAAGLALVVAAVLIRPEPWIIAVAAANGLFVAGTGFFGFCPACYLFGRRSLS